MIKEKNALKSRTKTVQNVLMGSSSDEDGDSDGSLSEEEADENTIRQKAISSIEKELQELEESDDEGSEESDGDDGNIKVNFSKKGQGNKKKGQEEKGIMGLKFMQRAEANKKEQLKEQAKLLIEQIKEE